jgi:hypothetical protein
LPDPSRRGAPVVFVCLLAGALTAASIPAAPEDAQGRAPMAAQRMRLAERIYRKGILPSGEPLRGVRAGSEVLGPEAACVLCHRRSGMGTIEGSRIVSPITGRFLYETRARAFAELDAGHTRGPDLAHAFGRNRTREPYTDQTLIAALREGVVPGGGRLEELMPRYALSDPDARLLVDYLRQLSEIWSPGVTRDTLHFGTVVAPGVDPARSKAMLDVLQAFFDVKNSAAGLEKQRDKSYSGSAAKTYRSWKLHVWELTGAPETWEAQLAAHYQRQPVFALISGVSEGTWEPVQRFCERLGLPCWFPTVDLPVVTGTDYYTAYFSGGVVLEAQVLARRLLDERLATRVVQIRSAEEAAAGAARALRKALESSGIRIEERVLRKVDSAELREALADVGSSEAVVFWLRGRDVAQLAGVPARGARAYFSAILAQGEHAPLPPAWKTQARILYPFELPEKRRAKTTRFHAWLKTRNLKLVDERLQADTYLASLLMAEKVEEMLESLYRDYLLERAESILSERLPTVIYHRLSLGPDQRFASKGGYIARFASPDSSVLVAETSWIVP